MGKVDYFERKLDDKNRLTIPPEMRDELAHGVVVPEGSENTYMYIHKMCGIRW